MDTNLWSRRARPFRALGYAGVGAQGLVMVLEQGQMNGWLLVAGSALWLVFTGFAPRLKIPEAGLCLADCLLVPLLGILVPVHLWACVVWSAVLLMGVAAHGGPRLLMRGSLVVAVTWSMLGGASLEGLLRSALWQIAVPVILLYASTLGIALVSFSQAERLRQRRVIAINESESLKDANSRLVRYLPESFAPGLDNAPGSRQSPVQRWVTVAFIDVVGFTELVAQRPLAEVVDVVNDYLASLADLVVDHGGVLGKFLGDGVLVYFPEAPANGRDRGDDAARCASLCLAVQPMLGGLAGRWRHRGLLVAFSIRTGIASGYCALGDWGGSGRLDYTLIGTAVNLASRLQVEAQPGSILISETAALLMGQNPALTPQILAAPDREIRGLGHCRIFRLVDERPASAKVPANSDQPSGVHRP